ncbi:MAG: hypothetical protein DMF68_08335 [Acidobacteria bacterium]|nr:MAG: hypothetical protein DMF68_08335 [Acidobacteriota bacterium]
MMTEQEKMNMRVLIGIAFRPGAPIDRFDLFAGRQAQVRDVIDATTQPGRHVIMFGERGVGKTSLAKVLSEILSNTGQHFLNSGTINCDGTDNYSSLWHKIFRELLVEIKSKGGAGFISKDGSETLILSDLLPEEVRPDDVRYVLSGFKKPVIIILDEIDRIKDRETTTLLADTIKNLSDHDVSATLILVGVADAVDGLIKEHRSVERALVQVPMPRMSRTELLQIVDKGLESSGMEIDEHAKDRIARLSQGLPHYTHLLGLHAANSAIEEGRMKIDMSDVNRATNTAVEKSHSILSDYHKATSSPQRQNLYDEVLLACALAETDDLGYFSAAAVAKPLSAIMNKQYYIPSFSRHLTDFCSEKRGPILMKTGEPRRYRFRFINPLMQPFVILHGLAKNLLTEELLWVATK